ncbi:rod shape-determining protein MreC [Halobacteroides halobius DSM 5150]|uniref:Cell shape-determining protein MreC n=1 Tax=Halobacteroides halobius (strain ATCC 35273 / DSM 5150 / MD-1) TaxID=748449 RepID=L0KCU0_HALHC|nr:rod shape-determining protein MreC [Halobacteroides halobius]AGB41893.1 rod shape-determining protein MreC [Halobacteroides halobius DSM 5150]
MVLNLFKKHYKKILVIILIVAVIVFINLLGVDKSYNFLEEVVIDLFNPIFSRIDRAQDWTSRTLRVILNYKEVKKENQRLKDRISNLIYKQQQLEKIMHQNQRLRKLLNFKKHKPYQVVGASVISRSTDNWSNTIMINCGKQDGVRRKMPVVAKKGYLIGRIQRVSEHSAQVILINDPNFVTGGLVRRKASRDLGVVKGQVKKNNKLLFDNLAWDANIKIGDTIVTSGLSKYYPKGLPIGEVISVRPDDYGLTQEATLLPFIDLKMIEEVLVITDFNTKTNISFPSLNRDYKLNQEDE